MEIKQILWENTRNLMINRYGEENLNKTAVESLKAGHKISIGSLARIKAQETAVGLDVLERLARFFNVSLPLLMTEGMVIKSHPLDKYKKQFDEAQDNERAMLLVMLASLNNKNRDNNELHIATQHQASN